MTRIIALTLALTACGGVQVRDTAEGAARRALAAICAAYTPTPTTPIWQRLAWALLCPEVP